MLYGKREQQFYYYFNFYSDIIVAYDHDLRKEMHPCIFSPLNF